MIRFLVGLLLGLVAGAAGAYVYLRKPAPVVAVAAPTPAAPTPTLVPPRRHHGPRPAVATDESIVLSAADQQVTAAGDALRTETTLDMAQGGEARDLAPDEIDATVARRSDAIIGCLRDARGAAPLSGRVVIGMVVDGNGRVARTRVEAPAYLVHHGLYDCARRAVAELQFPAVGRETVVHVPFTISDAP